MSNVENACTRGNFRRKHPRGGMHATEGKVVGQPNKHGAGCEVIGGQVAAGAEGGK